MGYKHKSGYHLWQWIFFASSAIVIIGMVTLVASTRSLDPRSQAAANSGGMCQQLCQRVCTRNLHADQSQDTDCHSRCNDLCGILTSHYESSRAPVAVSDHPVVLPTPNIHTTEPVVHVPTAAPHQQVPALDDSGGQTAHESETTNRDYLLHEPSGHPPAGGWPLIMYLHDNDIVTKDGVDHVANESLPLSLVSNHDFPFVVVSPKLDESDFHNNWLTDEADRSLMALLSEVQSDHAVNPDKTYLTGHSVGGGATWDLGLNHPDRFAAIAPVSGYYHETPTVPANICDLKNTGVWAFHGSADSSVPLAAEQHLVDALKNCHGSDVPHLTVVQGGNHNIDTAIHQPNNDALYDWMLTHSLDH